MPDEQKPGEPQPKPSLPLGDDQIAQKGIKPTTKKNTETKQDKK